MFLIENLTAADTEKLVDKCLAVSFTFQSIR